jgi:hypothetical protein
LARWGLGRWTGSSLGADAFAGDQARRVTEGRESLGVNVGVIFTGKKKANPKIGLSL